jgi:hypothetical protein
MMLMRLVAHGPEEQGMSWAATRANRANAESASFDSCIHGLLSLSSSLLNFLYVDDHNKRARCGDFGTDTGLLASLPAIQVKSPGYGKMSLGRPKTKQALQAGQRESSVLNGEDGAKVA